MTTPASADLVLPVTLLSRYLFFLGRRPVSASNTHFLARRVEALKSLAPFLEQDHIPGLRRAAAQLRALTPANLARVGARIQAELRPLLVRQMPRDVLASQTPPDTRFWQNTERILLVFGPGIGVGDEILCYAIPRVLRRLAPKASLSIRTTYDGLWEGAEVDGVERYRDLRALIDIVRATEERCDLLVLADFEAPALAPAMAAEPRVDRYLELSIGGRSVVALDNRARRLHQMPSLDPYCANFYDWLREGLRWIAGGAEGAPIAAAAMGNPEAHALRTELVVLASPFTSKDDPSERYWSTLLSAFLPSDIGRPVQLLIDTGPNADTKSFALALRKFVRAHADRHVRCDLAASPDGGVASLRDILRYVDGGLDIVVTADSYLAHAGPAFGAMTLVVAGKGLENWRVPSAGSFYFRVDDRVESVAAAMRSLLSESFNGHATSFRPSASGDAKRLRESAVRVRSAIDDAPLGDLLAAWNDCYTAASSVVASLPEWPRAYDALLSDHGYGRLMPPLPVADATAAPDELRIHLGYRLAECENSNLWKYLGATRA